MAALPTEQAPQNTERKYVPVKNIAEELEVTPQAVNAWLRRGKLKGTKPRGKKSWLVLETDFHEYLAQGENKVE